MSSPTETPVCTTSPSTQLTFLLTHLRPTPSSNATRSTYLEHLRNTLLPVLTPTATLTGIGSTPLRTYLPNADLNLHVDPPPNEDQLRAMAGRLASLCVTVHRYPVTNLTVTPTPTLTFHLNSLPVTITSSSTPSLLLPFLCEAYNLLPPLTQPLTILVKAWLRNEASRITNGIPVNLPSESVHLMVVQCLVAMEERPRASKTLLQLFQHFLSYYAHYDYSVPIDVLTGATPLHRKLVKITKSLTNSWSPSPTNTPSSPPDSPPPTAAVTILCPLTANNLTASLSPQTSHCLHYALAEGHRHLTAITEWWDESTNTPRGQTGTPMTTPMSDREPTGPATARSTPLSPLRNPSSSSSSNGNANTITSPTSFSSSLRAPSLNPPTLTIPSNDDGGDDDPEVTDTWFLQTFFANTTALLGYRVDVDPLLALTLPAVPASPTTSSAAADDPTDPTSVFYAPHGLAERRLALLLLAESRACKSSKKSKASEQASPTMVSQQSVGEEKKCETPGTPTRLVMERGESVKKIVRSKQGKQVSTQTPKQAVIKQENVKKMATTECQTVATERTESGGGESGLRFLLKYTLLLLSAGVLAIAIVLAAHAEPKGLGAGGLGAGGLGATLAPAETGGERGVESKTTTTVPHWVRIGESISLGDVTDGIPDAQGESPTYQWLKDGAVIAGATTSFFSIVESTQHAGGVYSCVITHADSVEVVDSTIKVSEVPVVNNNPGYYAVEAGSKLMLSVSSAGLPPPEFRWRLNGVVLKGGTESVYVVDSVAPENQGTYTCDVYNVAGAVLWEEAIVDVVA